jgi:TIR domain-containing protein
MRRFRIQLPSALAVRYVRYILGFGVAVGVGLAPFLGKYKLPFFEPLLGLFPGASKLSLIPTSAFLMGLVAVAVQFYSGEEIPQGTIRKRFGVGLLLVTLAFAALYVLYDSRMLQIKDPRTGIYVPHILGWSRLPEGRVCKCRSEEDDHMCAYALGLDLGRCWPSIPQVRMALHLSYLTLTGGFGALIGLLLLQEEARRQKKQKLEPVLTGVFDVFLCHNSADKPAVKRIGKQLQERGIFPWLDEWELPPGQPWQPLLERQIDNIKSAAVFVGSAGVGPWQIRELRGFLKEFDSRQCPVIPVLLQDAPEKPELPIFLTDMTWVDFRIQDPDPLDQLIWGITGKRPNRPGE